jgi:hypothetical protein
MHGHTRTSHDRCTLASFRCFFPFRRPLHRPAQRDIGFTEKNVLLTLATSKLLTVAKALQDCCPADRRSARMSPPVIGSEDGEKEAILEAVRLMLAAVSTEPKTAGAEDIVALIVYREEKDAVADTMDEMEDNRKIEGFK